MPEWAAMIRDILAAAIPVAATLGTGVWGLRIRRREQEHRKRADTQDAMTKAETVTTESWRAFVEQQREWASTQERIIARQGDRITEQDDKITELYGTVGALRTDVIRAEARARAAISFARDVVLWVEPVAVVGPPIGPPPPVPPVIADELRDITDRLTGGRDQT